MICIENIHYYLQGDEKYTSNESLGRPLAESTPNKDGGQARSNEHTNGSSSTNVPTGQLVDIPLFEGSDSTFYEVQVSSSFTVVCRFGISGLLL